MEETNQAIRKKKFPIWIFIILGIVVIGLFAYFFIFKNNPVSVEENTENGNLNNISGNKINTPPAGTPLGEGTASEQDRVGSELAPGLI